MLSGSIAGRAKYARSSGRSDRRTAAYSPEREFLGRRPLSCPALGTLRKEVPSLSPAPRPLRSKPTGYAAGRDKLAKSSGRSDRSTTTSSPERELLGRRPLSCPGTRHAEKSRSFTFPAPRPFRSKPRRRLPMPRTAPNEAPPAGNTGPIGCVLATFCCRVRSMAFHGRYR
jgi:hypothetical protein